MIVEISQIISCFALGLLVGSLLTEAMILVPYWRTMKPDEFLKLHHTLGPKLYVYFAPLTIVATLAPVIAAVLTVYLKPELSYLDVVPAVLTLIMLVIYFAYFKGANESFEMGSVGVDGLSKELSQWARWHWLRVVLGLAAFFVSILVVFKLV
jgi:hypothetical protein